MTIKRLDRQTYLRVSGIVFFIAAVIHALRVINGWDVVVGSWSVPIWISVLVSIGTFYLAYTVLTTKK